MVYRVFLIPSASQLVGVLQTTSFRENCSVFSGVKLSFPVNVCFASVPFTFLLYFYFLCQWAESNPGLMRTRQMLHTELNLWPLCPLATHIHIFLSPFRAVVRGRVGLEVSCEEHPALQCTCTLFSCFP